MGQRHGTEKAAIGIEEIPHCSRSHGYNLPMVSRRGNSFTCSCARAFYDFVGPGDILILLADIDAKLLSDGLKPRQGD